MISINKPGTFAESLEEKLSLPFMEAGTDNTGRVWRCCWDMQRENWKGKIPAWTQPAHCSKAEHETLYKYNNSKKRAKENLCPVLNVAENVTGIRKRVRCSIPSLYLSLKVKRVILGVLYSLNWKSGMGSRMIQVETVRDLLLHLDCHKSMGSDEIHPRVSRELAEAPIYLPSIGITCHPGVREDWRLANVIAIYKKGNEEDLENYRPISLTSVQGKFVEEISLSEITQHVQDNQGSGPASMDS